ncbi:hypothetical protein Hdeb2414_s0107g00796521 [Helianthus debilis subsp. tardiflorus]
MTSGIWGFDIGAIRGTEYEHVLVSSYKRPDLFPPCKVREVQICILNSGYQVSNLILSL